MERKNNVIHLVLLLDGVNIKDTVAHTRNSLVHKELPEHKNEFDKFPEIVMNMLLRNNQFKEYDGLSDLEENERAVYMLSETQYEDIQDEVYVGENIVDSGVTWENKKEVFLMNTEPQWFPESIVPLGLVESSSLSGVVNKLNVDRRPNMRVLLLEGKYFYSP